MEYLYDILVFKATKLKMYNYHTIPNMFEVITIFGRLNFVHNKLFNSSHSCVCLLSRRRHHRHHLSSSCPVAYAD